MTGTDKTHLISDRWARIINIDLCSEVEPTTTEPYMAWIQPSTQLLKIRNGTDTAWLEIGGGGGSLDDAYDEGRTITADAGAVQIQSTGGLEVEAAIRLGEVATPPNVANKGFILCQDDGGNTELFYEDDDGNLVQITRDGEVVGSWPFYNLMTVDHDDPQADFPTLAAGIAVLDGLICLELGPDAGTDYTFNGSIAAQTTIRGALSPGHDGNLADFVTVDFDHITVDAGVRFQNLDIDGELTVRAGWCVFENCIIHAAAVGDFITATLWVPDTGRIIFRNCKFIAGGSIVDLPNGFGSVEFYDCHCEMSGPSTITHDAEDLVICNMNWDPFISFVGAGTRTNLGKPVAQADVVANIPAAPFFDGEFFYATDTDALYVGDGGAWVAVGGGDDEKVKVTANDTTADYLLAKLAAGTGIAITEINDGGDEDAQIAVTTHAHAAAGSGGQLDWDDIWSDAVHTHQSDAEGGDVPPSGAIVLWDNSDV